MKDFFRSKKWTAVLAIIFILCLMLAIFEAGVAVGVRKASFADRMGGDYYKVFGQSGSPFGGVDQDDFPASHGVVGTIIKIAPPYAFIQGPDNTERTVRLNASTTILKYRTAIGPNDLSDGESIIVIGSPSTSSSDIDARFVWSGVRLIRRAGCLRRPRLLLNRASPHDSARVDDARAGSPGWVLARFAVPNA